MGRGCARGGPDPSRLFSQASSTINGKSSTRLRPNPGLPTPSVQGDVETGEPVLCRSQGRQPLSDFEKFGLDGPTDRSRQQASRPPETRVGQKLVIPGLTRDPRIGRWPPPRPSPLASGSGDGPGLGPCSVKSVPVSVPGVVATTRESTSSAPRTSHLGVTQDGTVDFRRSPRRFRPACNPAARRWFHQFLRPQSENSGQARTNGKGRRCHCRGRPHRKCLASHLYRKSGTMDVLSTLWVSARGGHGPPSESGFEKGES